MAKFDILIADDHPLFRNALRQALLLGLGNGTKLVEVENISDLEQRLLKKTSWDLVLLDLTMPGAYGFSGLVSLRGQYPHIPVVLISAQENHSVIARAKEFGASGFIPKSSSLEMIQKAVQDVLSGETCWPAIPEGEYVLEEETKQTSAKLASLTSQQFKVLTMLCDGLLNKQIAYNLGVSEATVKAHVTAIFRKLDVKTRTQAVLLLQKMESLAE